MHEQAVCAGGWVGFPAYPRCWAASDPPGNRELKGTRNALPCLNRVVVEPQPMRPGLPAAPERLGGAPLQLQEPGVQ